MSFIEKLAKMKRKLIIISAVILCLVFGGVGLVKYTNAAHVKDGIVLGNKCLQEEKYEVAILAFNKVINIESTNIEAWVGLAKAYIKTGKPAKAEKVLKDAISINPKKVEPYLELAKLYVFQNNPVDAIKILTDVYKATNDETIKSMLEDLKSKTTVDNIDKTITLGENYSLPKEVLVKINNIEVQLPVRWDKTSIDMTKVGINVFIGTLETTGKEIKATINVIGITSIENINKTIKQNDKYSLPSKLTTKMTDGSTREVEVTWSPSGVDTRKAGTYSYEGTISGYSNKIKLTLNITADQKVTNYEEVFRNLLGKPISKLKEKFGQCVSKTTNTIYDTEVQKYSGFTVSYNISSGKIFSFIITNSKLTVSGLNCGMSGDKVINKFGKPKYIIDEDDFGSGISDYTYIYDNIQFFFNNGSFDKITGIVIQ
jgi:tetratricopeptide (TPR) repeat protein